MGKNAGLSSGKTNHRDRRIVFTTISMDKTRRLKTENETIRKPKLVEFADQETKWSLQRYRVVTRVKLF